jgi:hypothetical protein
MTGNAARRSGSAPRSSSRSSPCWPALLERLLDSGVELGWFTADEAYGDNPDCGHGWNNVVSTTSWPSPAINGSAPRSAPYTPMSWPVTHPARAGHGSQQDWAASAHCLYGLAALDPGADEHLLLVRRSISKPTELAYYLCHTAHPVPLAELVRVAGSRGVSRKFSSFVGLAEAI